MGFPPRRAPRSAWHQVGVHLFAGVITAGAKKASDSARHGRMALNLDAVGRKIGPFVRSYDWKDLALYAVGVGAGFDELDYCYEKRLRVIPTFGAAMTFEVVWHLAALSQLNAAGVVHGEHEMVFRHPIPPQGTLITEGAIARYYDIGVRGVLIRGFDPYKDAIEYGSEPVRPTWMSTGSNNVPASLTSLSSSATESL